MNQSSAAFVWHDYRSAPFRIDGLPWHDAAFPPLRLPPETLDAVASDGLREFARHTSGGAVRFRTGSTRLAVRVAVTDVVLKDRMAPTGQSGMDLYLGGGTDKTFFNVFRPDPENRDGYRGEFRLPDEPGGEREITLYLPLFNGVRALEIGVDRDCAVLPPERPAIPHPIAFYGSSITQGAFASRPGNTYVAMLGRMLDAEVINLGFAGNARGELALAAAIASLDLSLLVLDYDHNSPDPEFLQRTHEPFFRLIRERRPTLPVLMVSRPDFYGAEFDLRRREVVRRTWRNAVASGDRLAFFCDGETLFGSDSFRDSCTVDAVHPNDLGFARMAGGLYPELLRMLPARGEERPSA